MTDLEATKIKLMLGQIAGLTITQNGNPMGDREKAILGFLVENFTPGELTSTIHRIYASGPDDERYSAEDACLLDDARNMLLETDMQ